MEQKIKCCIDCGNEQVVERKRCRECALIHNRKRVKKYYKKDKPRYGIVDCSICGEKMIKNKPNQVAHGRCRRKTVINYNTVSRTLHGNTKGRQMILDLGLKLDSTMVVHHFDENPSNNTLSNLWVMSRSMHNSLHRFLQHNWSIFKKLDISNQENCWNILRDDLTTTWLETTGVKVLKISHIGQSAAELLNVKEYIYTFTQEEGAETLHDKPKFVNIDYCKTCQKSFAVNSKNKTFCSVDCYRRYNHSTVPTPGEIFEAFDKHKNFLQVGRYFGVSDNAVRKWCNSYGITSMVKRKSRPQILN